MWRFVNIGCVNFEGQSQAVEQFALFQMNMGREVCRRLRITDTRLFAAEMNAQPQTMMLDVVKRPAR